MPASGMCQSRSDTGTHVVHVGLKQCTSLHTFSLIQAYRVLPAGLYHRAVNLRTPLSQKAKESEAAEEALAADVAALLQAANQRLTAVEVKLEAAYTQIESMHMNTQSAEVSMTLLALS